jgi:sugar phosphate isomerase/epimerase
MKFGVVTHAVGHHLSFEKTLSTIKEIGFDSILLLSSRDSKAVNSDGTCESPFPNLLGSDPAHVRLALDNAGLEIGAVHFAGKIDISSDEGVQPTIEALKEYASYTLALGCKYLTHHVPSCGRLHTPTKEKATEILRLAKCMNTVAEAFANENLKISVDIHQSAFVEGLDDCRLLVDSMPQKNAGLLLNIGHLTTVQAYGWLLVDEYPDRIPVVGWKDHSLAKVRPQTMWSVELGCGHSPFELYVKAFKRHPAERVHLINCENIPDEERIGTLRRSLDYMKRLWNET